MRSTCRRHAVSRAFGDRKRSGRHRSRVNLAMLGSNASSPSSTAVNRASSLCVSPGARRLIERAQDPELLIRILEDKEQRLQFVFERDVMRHLVRADYRVNGKRVRGVSISSWKETAIVSPSNATETFFTQSKSWPKTWNGRLSLKGSDGSSPVSAEASRSETGARDEADS
jgi:hypothetical protein